mgnify:CR=1 FL=1
MKFIREKSSEHINRGIREHDVIISYAVEGFNGLIDQEEAEEMVKVMGEFRLDRWRPMLVRINDVHISDKARTHILTKRIPA